MTLKIDSIYGACPVQAEGTFDDVPFYFRSRGERIGIGVGFDPVGVYMGVAEGWNRLELHYEFPQAGYISQDEARKFIEESYSMWRQYVEGE